MSAADEAWPLIVDAFAHYGKRLSPRLRGERRKLIERLLDEYEPDELVAVVHGYVRFHEGLDVKPDGFDPGRYFTPRNLFVLAKIDDRLELGLEGPWRKPETAQERRERERREQYEEARAQVAREREEKLRAV